ncbi:DUF1707 SHOCT-like domain-containing protein [Millisia brevis]|uniref:DUF1707 SHOCT-like domain-containing protein n=1 Tax=Millisia brevis TaxID=264148 RepID=UPI000AC4C6B7|nr:DUF1707 domain-containing protein [Millisia brevis]
MTEQAFPEPQSASPRPTYLRATDAPESGAVIGPEIPATGPSLQKAPTSLPTTPPGPAGMRASTADRERVALVLQTAMAEGRITADELSERLGIVYQAKTLGELEPVTRDLPAHRPLVTEVPRSAVAPQPQHMPAGTYTSSSAIAIMSGVERKGMWAVPDTFTAVAVMGGAEIDLTEAIFTAGEVTINAFALCGGIEIKVPDDVLVQEDGIGIMGGFDSKVPPTGDLPRAIVKVRGLALMGGVEVRRLSDKERRKRVRKQEKQALKQQRADNDY